MNIKSYNLDKYSSEIDQTIAKLKERDLVNRLFAHDHTIWSESPDEITNRLGWLQSPEYMLSHIEEIESFVTSCKADGIKKVLLLGMGGSSLAPELFNEVFNKNGDGLELRIADSTHPDKVAELSDYFDPNDTLYIVSTKSGGTVETTSLMNFFYNQCCEVIGKDKAGSHFASITDPGSKLEEISGQLGFRKCFLNDPNIGGRFSVLSYFGLVPAALVGIDLHKFLTNIMEYASDITTNKVKLTDLNNPINLGTVTGLLADKGLDKLTFVISDELSSFGDWLEQLIAESSGKEEKGILPVLENEIHNSDSYSKDRVFVCLGLESDKKIVSVLADIQKAGMPLIAIKLQDKIELGVEFYRWEIVTAVACAVLKVNPFDQPNVESTKIIGRKFLAEFKEKGQITEPKHIEVENCIKIYSDDKFANLKDALSELIGDTQKLQNRYISVHAYICQNQSNMQKLAELKKALGDKTGIPVTIGFGPRFLHSTGQLHKGDGGGGIFLQIVSEPREDIPIPDNAGASESSLSFGTLIKSQYLGDRTALLEANRKVLSINIGANTTTGLDSIINSVQ